MTSNYKQVILYLTILTAANKFTKYGSEQTNSCTILLPVTRHTNTNLVIECQIHDIKHEIIQILYIQCNNACLVNCNLKNETTFNCSLSK